MVAALGSFTRAAERLHLTPSAVSWQVRRLRPGVRLEIVVDASAIL